MFISSSCFYISIRKTYRSSIQIHVYCKQVRYVGEFKRGKKVRLPLTYSPPRPHQSVSLQCGMRVSCFPLTSQSLSCFVCCCACLAELCKQSFILKSKFLLYLHHICFFRLVKACLSAPELWEQLDPGFASVKSPDAWLLATPL